MKKILLINDDEDIDRDPFLFVEYDIVIQPIDDHSWRFLKCKSKFHKSQPWDRDIMLDLIYEDDYDYGDPDDPNS